MRYLTPLRYPGGKAKLANFIALLVRSNALSDGDYVEPYAGGASVALALLLGEHVANVHINDVDRGIYAFWWSVLNRSDALCRRIRDTAVSVAEWRRQRAVQARAHDADLLELGFATFFLNRTNRSGIIASGGVIGGLKQAGTWGLNARFNREALVERIDRIALYRDRITLTNLDAAGLLREMAPRLPARSLLYLDPPYYRDGRRRLYASAYHHAEHEEIARLLSRVRLPWIVSYDDVYEIRRLYSGYQRLSYQLAYSARERKDGAEVMFFSDSVVLPALRNPTTVTVTQVNGSRSFVSRGDRKGYRSRRGRTGTPDTCK